MRYDIILIQGYRSMRGGVFTYTRHLAYGLKNAGKRVLIVNITGRKVSATESLYGLEGIYAAPERALELIRTAPALMTCNMEYKKPWEVAWISEALFYGMRTIVHDAKETKLFQKKGVLESVLASEPIVIRRAGQDYLGSASIPYIKHPYVPVLRELDKYSRLKTAVCVARTSFNKRQHLILDANRSLPDRLKVHMLGAPNRMYIWVLKQKGYTEKDLEMVSTTGFEEGPSAAVAQLKSAKLAVDFTHFPAGDGGGTQYTFLEAWDSGTVNVVHKDWMKTKHEDSMAHMKNCLVVDGPDELAALIKEVAAGKLEKDIQRIRKAGREQLLKDHDPLAIANEMYREVVR